jgi:hypothetical protein
MNKTDPMQLPMVFLRVGWMERYQGLSGDTITGGGKYVQKTGYGHEMFNFRPFRGKVYGYVRPVSTNVKWANATIDIDRIGGTKSGDELDGVLVVWVATDPYGGGHVVGWYKDAMVHRQLQDPPGDPGRMHKGEEFRYYAEAKASDSVCLPVDARVIQVPYGSGGMGNSNVWYADDPAKHQAFRREVLRFAETRTAPVRRKKGGRGLRQPDPLLRQKIEIAAVKHTTNHFEGLGFDVDSIEKDNLGWDLVAVRGKRELRLEVKGLSGSQLVVELTPNEFAAMKSHRDSYRVCIVSMALTKPTLEVFAYSAEANHWESQLTEGKVLAIEKIVAARCTVT